MTEDADLARARACARLMFESDHASRSLGMKITIPAPGEAVAVMTVTDEMLNGHAVCHGGFIFALADSAFAFACNAYDDVTLAGGASIDFLRPAKLGETLTANAAERQRGKRVGVYDVVVENSEGRTVALFRGRAVASGRPLLPGDRAT